MPALTAEVAVAGGGPAGAAAAVVLAEAGRDVLVLERGRDAGRKVCGEFLSAETLAALEALGVPAAGLGAAAIGRVRLSAGGHVAEAALPFRAAGLSRAALDAALLARAEAAGARVLRGAAVRAAGAGGLVLADGREVAAGAVLLATGKHELAGRRRATGWRGRDGMIGLKMPLGLDRGAARRLGAAIELHFFGGGCAGLQPVEGAANLCVTLQRGVWARAGGDFAGLVARIAAENAAFAAALRGARPLWAKPAAIARVPYGFVAQRGAGGALWRVGDQVAVTASFTGDGLALALASGRAAAEALMAGEAPAVYEAAFAARAARQVRRAMALQALVDRPELHRPAVAAARRLPAAIRLAARWTRLPGAEPAPGRIVGRRRAAAGGGPRSG